MLGLVKGYPILGLYSRERFTRLLGLYNSTETSFLILTDSLSAIQALTYTWTSNSLLRQIHRELDTLAEKDLIFCRIPSHTLDVTGIRL